MGRLNRHGHYEWNQQYPLLPKLPIEPRPQRNKKPDVVDHTDPHGLLLHKTIGIGKQNEIRPRISVFPERQRFIEDEDHIDSRQENACLPQKQQHQQADNAADHNNHEGKAVEVHAEEGEEALRSILTLDEGSAYLGEVALVPFDSPINNPGLLFFSTLYDENAACHLALGRGFTNLYPDFEKYTEDQIHSFGITKSLSHVDFMIGSKDLNIVGTTEDGREIQVFQNGNWAF